VARFGGGAYHPILRNLEAFSDKRLRSILGIRRIRPRWCCEEKDAAAVKKLKESGFAESVLAIVVAYQPVLRWIKATLQLSKIF
jgi:hypothetical protein